MRKELEQIEKIEAYLNGELPADETAAFETEMDREPDLRENVQLQSDLMQGIGRAALTEKIQKTRQRYRRWRRFRNWGGGGFAILVLLFTLFHIAKFSPAIHGRRNTVMAVPGGGRDSGWTGAEGVAVKDGADGVAGGVGAGGVGARGATADGAADEVARGTGAGGASSGGAGARGATADGADAGGERGVAAGGTAATDKAGGAGAGKMGEAGVAGGKMAEAGAAGAGITVFTIDASQDTVIETRGGIVLSVPARAFLDEDERPVTGRLSLSVREALDAVSIIQAGLSTLSGDRLLETGGMFCINAFKDGKALQMDAAKSIYADVPTSVVKSDMQLFSGSPSPANEPLKWGTEGGIDWIDPQPLEHYLIPVDNHLLDYYPPHYLDSVRRWGYNAQDRRFTDSLYYSCAFLFADGMTVVAKPIAPAEGRSELAGGDRVRKEFVSDSVMPAKKASTCGINPAKIKAIWSDAFQNTLIATREFEQRMRLIHESRNEGLLDLYVNNLDKNLSTIDSMAAKQSNGTIREKFLAFAARRDGRVRHGVGQLDKLRKYYTAKAQLYTAVLAKTEREFWDGQAELDKHYADHVADSSKRMAQNFGEEFRLNFNEACRQLGYDTGYRPPAANVYHTQVRKTGWFNIDRYVRELVTERKTAGYSDPETGKTAVIHYSPVTFQLDQVSMYDRLSVYLLPNRLSSCIRLNDASGVYAYSLNELIGYNLVCIGYKGRDVFFFSREMIKAGDYAHIQLHAINGDALYTELLKYGDKTQISGLGEEEEFHAFVLKDRERLRRNEELYSLQTKMIDAFFGCEILY